VTSFSSTARRSHLILPGGSRTIAIGMTTFAPTVGGHPSGESDGRFLLISLTQALQLMT
jgi:hypothetical protein